MYSGQVICKYQIADNHVITDKINKCFLCSRSKAYILLVSYLCYESSKI